MRIGIMGGTFNPPHIGHINAAKSAKRSLDLSELILIPTAIPPHKEMAEDSANTDDRLHMTRLIAELADAEVSDFEIVRGGRSYTVDTLTHFKEIYPEDELWLIMGTDMFLTLEEWREPERIFKLSNIAVVPRNSDDREKLLLHGEHLKNKYGATIRIIDVPAVTISSSDIRPEPGQMAEYIPQSVLSYIKEKKLYGSEAAELD
ncbi:MAG: nicotinate (nicotinamide) nucleotide adenylyltransferase [Oscillospiraceae bacterium]|nr:nicotinate (nicotinamide) nucleotide adenylyltransferase [Oscillospiraceae bacterium]